MRALIADLKDIKTLAEANSSEGEGDLSTCIHALDAGIETLSTATDILLNAKDEDALSVATPYLTLCAKVLSGALLIKAVANGLGAGDAHAAPMASLARFHALAVMPGAAAELDSIRAGGDPVFDFPVGQLADL